MCRSWRSLQRVTRTQRSQARRVAAALLLARRVQQLAQHVLKAQPLAVAKRVQQLRHAARVVAGHERKLCQLLTCARASQRVCETGVGVGQDGQA